MVFKKNEKEEKEQKDWKTELLNNRVSITLKKIWLNWRNLKGMIIEK